MAFAAFSRVPFAVLCSLVFILNAVAQQSAQTGSSAGGGSGGRYIGTQRSSAGNSQTLFPARTPFIIGSVVMSDGTPLPTGVVIERVCSGQAKREAYVDVNGNFSFQLGAGYVLPDASDPGQLSTSDPGGSVFGSMTGNAARMPVAYADCELRAQLGGYRSTSIRLDPSRLMGQADVGTIVLRPIARAPGITVSVTELSAPGKAKKSLQKAEAAIRRNEWQRAQEDLREALRSSPGFAPAWLRLGQVLEQTCRNDEAREAFSKAIAADANFVPPYVELARLAAQDRSWQEAADLAEYAAQLNPLDFPAAFYLDGMANLYLGRLDAAENSVHKAQRIDSQNRLPQTHLLLASILHRKKDHAAEIIQLRDYLRLAPHAADAEMVRSQLQVLELTGHR